MFTDTNFHHTVISCPFGMRAHNSNLILTFIYFIIYVFIYSFHIVGRILESLLKQRKKKENEVE